MYKSLWKKKTFYQLKISIKFIPKILAEDAKHPELQKGSLQAGSVSLLLIQVVVLSVFMLPVAMICLNISTLDFWTFFKKKGNFFLRAL